MRAFASFMDFSQSALFFDPYFKLVILHLLKCLYTIPQSVFGRTLSRLPQGLLLNIWFIYKNPEATSKF